jgi:hypothetical protein
MAGAAYGHDEFEIASYPAVDYNIRSTSGQKKQQTKSIPRGMMEADRPVATYTSAANIKR